MKLLPFSIVLLFLVTLPLKAQSLDSFQASKLFNKEDVRNKLFIALFNHLEVL